MEYIFICEINNGIPVALFHILKDDAVKVLHSTCQQIWKTQQWPQDWKRSVFMTLDFYSSGFSIFMFYIWRFWVHVLLKPILKDFEHNLASTWNKCNCMVVWTFLDIILLWDWNENWPFQSCGHCWVFQIWKIFFYCLDVSQFIYIFTLKDI